MKICFDCALSFSLKLGLVRFSDINCIKVIDTADVIGLILTGGWALSVSWVIVVFEGDSTLDVGLDIFFCKFFLFKDLLLFFQCFIHF